jgi:hypothetical protein
MVRAAEDNAQPYPTCDRTPTDGDVAAAKGAFQAGNASFNEADYDRAINYWEDAYRRDCTAHPLLLNLARAYELNGQKRKAVNALQTFLARSPGSSEEAQIKRRIEKLEEQIQNENAAPPPAATAPAPARPVPAATTPSPSETEPAPAPPVRDESQGGKRSVVPLVVAGAGGAVAIVGTVLFVTASSDVSDYEKRCPHRQCPTTSLSDQANAARTRMTIGGVAMGVGGAAIAGGLVWYFLQEPESDAKTAVASHPLRARIAPSFGPGFGGLDVAGTF